ncbi:YecA family protein [Vibrio jasicida]|uniref:YecA/YgfB family protein n=1 Tax=Vibrio jasicida TaxID=766224 RepID=UPI00148E18D1|nr:YecA family protein [Vibrio jasicida]NOJ17255.1 YecA family protein [Vibrio jasicida]
MSATNQPINKWYSILKLQDILSLPELDGKLLNLAKTQGFVTAMASAPNVLNPQEWLPFLWGGEETAPFTDGEQLEQYIDEIVQMWNQTRPALLEGAWQWPEDCELDDQDIVSANTRDFCEGVLQGWQLTRDDWETLMPEDSEDSALLGGVLLSLTMLYDPETTIATLAEQGMEGLEQFEEIFNAMPMMLGGLTQRGVMLAEEE